MGSVMSWEPVQGTHAIERVAVTISLAGQIGHKAHDEVITRLQQAASGAGINELVVIQPLAFSVNLAPNAAPHVQPQHGMTGRAMRRTVGSVVEEELVFDGSAILYSATVYSSWEAVKERLPRMRTV